MQLLRSAALHAAAATSPLTRAPTTGLMVDSRWTHGACAVLQKIHDGCTIQTRPNVGFWLCTSGSAGIILAGSWVLIALSKHGALQMHGLFDGALSRPVRRHV